MTGADSQGGVERDPRGVAYRRQARAEGLVTGAYHGLVPKVPGREQALAFYDVLDDAGAFWDELPVAIDVELAGITERLLLEFLEAFWRRAEMTTWIYTSAHLWHRLIGKDRAWILRETASTMTLTQRALAELRSCGPVEVWVADWRDRAAPAVPTPWREWAMWQRSSKVGFPGYGSVVDFNLYRDTEARFRERFCIEGPESGT